MTPKNLFLQIFMKQSTNEVRMYQSLRWCRWGESLSLKELHELCYPKKIQRFLTGLGRHTVPTKVPSINAFSSRRPGGGLHFPPKMASS